MAELSDRISVAHNRFIITLDDLMCLFVLFLLFCVVSITVAVGLCLLK